MRAKERAKREKALKKSNMFRYCDLVSQTISQRKARLRYVNERLYTINVSIKRQQALLVQLKREATEVAKLERKKAKQLSSQRPPKKGRRRATRTPAPFQQDPYAALLRVRENKQTR